MSLFSFPAADPGIVPEWLSTDPERVRQALSTKEGWHQFVDAKPTRPKHLTGKEIAVLDSQSSLRFAQARITFHRSLVLVKHRQLEVAWTRMAPIVMGQYADDGPGMGIAVTGGPGHGKTAAITTFGREYERELRAAHPDAFRQTHEFIPVAYSSLLRGGGLKAQMQHILGFYGEPVGSKESGPALVDRLVRVMNACSTKILILDQAQNLKANDRNDQIVAAHIKHLMDDTSATIILTGIDLDTAGPLAEAVSGRSGGDREQLSRRFNIITMQPLRLESPEWANLLTSIESTLVLGNHQRGDLSKTLSEQIWTLSQGAIGVTFNVCKVAANYAIQQRKERLTADVLRSAAKTMDAHRRAQKGTAA